VRCVAVNVEAGVVTVTNDEPAEPTDEELLKKLRSALKNHLRRRRMSWKKRRGW
jgi:hypothetical protein